jgi:hypothetical protein
MKIEVGQMVTYTDEHGNKRPALVTNVGIPDSPTTWLNLVIVHTDENQKDDYGRKIERRTSVGVAHEGWTGNYWEI